jgi:hypothetical protein
MLNRDQLRAAEAQGQAEATKATTEKARERDWMPKFLEALRSIPNVRYAAEMAGISRQHAYKVRARDEGFLLAWHDAQQEGLDLMERVAHTRATAGQTITKTTTRRTPDGEVEVTTVEERHISDSLLMFLLKRYRPEFRETFKVTGVDGGAIKHEVTVVEEAVSDFYAELDRLHETGERNGDGL